MLDLVMELERNGRNLQHFCRELARYFRNLLVAKVAGREHAPDRGLRRTSRSGWPQIAAGFSEEDLTRYLQLTLDLFKDLQFSLQPRLHLEIGLLRLVQAGRAASPIEEGAGGLGEAGGRNCAQRKRSTAATPRRKPRAACASRQSASPPVQPTPAGPCERDRVCTAALLEARACSSPPTPWNIRRSPSRTASCSLPLPKSSSWR